MSISSTSEPEAFVCDCKESVRSACTGETFYKDHEGKRYCVLHFPGREKSADFKQALQRKLESNDFNFRGVWFPDELSFAKFSFDQDADFARAVFSDGADFNEATFKSDAFFTYATFINGASFANATFEVTHFQGATFGASTSFDSATFNEVAFFQDVTFSGGAYFNATTFNTKVSFSSAKFTAAHFRSAKFKITAFFNYATFGARADFSYAAFSGAAFFSHTTFCDDADFNTARFGADVDFRLATFGLNGNFRSATFGDRVGFAGSDEAEVIADPSSMDLQFARIEKADRVSFYSLTLHPHWFVNVDAREFDFVNVKWANSGRARPELELLQRTGTSSPHRLLAITARKLAANAQENDRYREASHFRRMAMDAERLEKWRGFGFLKLSWWYWLASGYGERPFQALLVLLGVMLLFGGFYQKVGFLRWEPRVATESDAVAVKRDEVGAPLSFGRALTYSAAVLTLQRPEPRPATTAAQTIVLVETILGPVQAALLALAIRRKFMR